MRLTEEILNKMSDEIWDACKPRVRELMKMAVKAKVAEILNKMPNDFKFNAQKDSHYGFEKGFNTCLAEVKKILEVQG